MTHRLWRSVRDLRDAEFAYRKTWWRHDVHVAAACQRRPELVDKLTAIYFPRTTDVFRAADRTYDPERVAVHDEIGDRQLGYGVPPSVPTVYFTIGCMGSGKTTVLRQFVHAHRLHTGGQNEASLSLIAADEVREALPGYDEGLGSRVVDPECFDVTYGRVFPMVRDAGFDIVYDTIGTMKGSNPSFLSQLLELKTSGYRIYLLRADAPFLTCQERAEARALATGRIVDAADQTKVFYQPIAVEERLRALGLVDGWMSVDTSSVASSAAIIDASDDWSDLHPQLEQIVFPGR